MIRINVTETLRKEAKRKAEIKPLPKVRVISQRANGKQLVTQDDVTRDAVAQVTQTELFDEKTHLVKSLWDDFAALKRQRGELSSQTFAIVEQCRVKLEKEGPATANAFMHGELAMPEIKEHYGKIQALTERMGRLYEQTRHVEQYGKLPVEPGPDISGSQTEDEKLIQYEIRRLDDLIYKCNAKLQKSNAGLKAPKNSERTAIWKQKIALAEAKRADLKHKLKTKQYEARAERQQ